MKKIPTLFERTFSDDHKARVIEPPVVAKGLEWVLNGEGYATEKIDGACCAIIDGKFYKRYDAKHGKKAPEGAIPCCDPDPVTGHHPHWVEVDFNDKRDKWFVDAYYNTPELQAFGFLEDGTYEAVGLHFQNNPYGLSRDILVKHGIFVVDVERTFEGIKKYLNDNMVEGIVFYTNDGVPACKIKRTDFGFPWGAVN